MYRKVLITALMLSLGMVGFSKTEKNKPKKIENVNPKELAKTVAENAQKALLNDMQLQLKDGKPDMMSKLKHMTEQQQFLYQENLIDSVLKAKSHLLEDVLSKLCNKSNRPTNLIYKGINTCDIDITYKKFETGKKQGQVDSTTLIVPVSFQAHTIAKNGISDVKYDVTFTWKVKVKAQTENQKIVGYIQDGYPTLVASVAEPIPFLTSDKKNMKKAAQEAIIKWYANLPQTLDKQYAEQSTIKPMNVSADGITMDDLPQSQNFTITEVPTIKVNIDPYQFISDDAKLYTNPEAYIVVAPTFDVSVDDSFKKAEISVSYELKDTIKPVADEYKKLRRSAADSVITEFAKQLSTYVTSRDNEQKASIENMFGAAENEIEVSYLPKRGKERRKKESAQKYLSLLKGSSLKLVRNNLEVVNPNWDSLVYIVTQEYRSKTYSDYTQKRIYLIYDFAKGTYVINKIEVVPNSTRKVE